MIFSTGMEMEMRWARHMARMGEERGVYRVLLGKPEGKRPLVRPRRRWVVNIRRDLQEVGCGYMDWIGLAQDRDRWRTLVSAVMNLQVPRNAGNFLTSFKPVSFSRSTPHHRVSKYLRAIFLVFNFSKHFFICPSYSQSSPLSFVRLLRFRNCVSYRPEHLIAEEKHLLAGSKH